MPSHVLDHANACVMVLIDVVDVLVNAQSGEVASAQLGRCNLEAFVPFGFWY